MESLEIHIEQLPKENGNSVAVSVEKLTVDCVLQKWVGEFGWGQFWQFFLVSLAWSIESMHTLVMIFADKEPQWRCTDAVAPNLMLLSNTTSLCSPSSNICDLDPSSWEWVESASVSSVSQFGLICGDHYKVGLVQSFFFIGCLIGAGIFGNLSDSFLGRKGSLVLACVMTGLVGIATAFSPTYYVYLIIRGLAGVSVAGVGLSSFVLATEPIGPSKRGQLGMSAFYFFSFGIMCLPLVAYLTQSWRALYMVISVASLLYSCSVLPFVFESPRWYLVKGRADDAMAVLRAIAKGNGRTVPPGVTVITDEDNEPDQAPAPLPLPEGPAKTSSWREEEQQQQPGAGSSPTVHARKSGTLIDVFVLPATRWRMVIMIFIWFTCAVVYYGLSLNIVNLGFNLYLGVFFNSLVEVPAFAITAALTGRLGRRRLVIFTMLLSGIACLLATLFPDPNPSSSSAPQGLASPGLPSPGSAPIWSPMASPGGGGASKLDGFTTKDLARLLCGVVGIFGMAGTYNLIFIYTCELFPTVVRNAALGLAIQAGQIGAITAPMIAGLGHSNTALPFIAFGIPGVLGGLAAVGLPETLNQPMWETMDELKKGEATKH